jgi:hypothetical protein
LVILNVNLTAPVALKLPVCGAALATAATASTTPSAATSTAPPRRRRQPPPNVESIASENVALRPPMGDWRHERPDSSITVVVPPPAISKLSVSPRKVSLAGRSVKGKCVKPTKNNSAATHCQRPIKLTIGYTLNTADNVTFRLELKSPGREVPLSSKSRAAPGRLIDRW